MKVGVIGGGMAGLSAAYELGKRGHRVALFEKEPQLGGQVGTLLLGGERVERFYHHIFTSDAHMIRLIAELGLGERLEWLDSRVGFLHGGRIYDFVTPWDLLRFSPLGPLERVRLGVVSLYLRRYRDWPRLEGKKAEEWLTRYGGRRSYEIVWGPMLKNKFGSSSTEVGMVWLWGKIHLRLGSRAGNRERLGYLRGSFGLLIDALAERIANFGGKIYTSSPVDEIVVQGEKAVGLNAEGEFHPFDCVVATVPSPAFLRMVPQLPRDYASRLEGVRYQGALCLLLVLSRPLSQVYWLNISDPAIPFVAAIEHTNLIHPSTYGGRHILYLSNYLSLDDPLYQLDRDRLLEVYLPHLARINPEFEPGWIEECYLFREEAGQPIITTGYSSRIAEHRTPIPNLYLANTTQIYPEDRGMNYSAALGLRVSEIL